MDENPNGKEAGSAYVFEQSGGRWHQAAKLTAQDGDSEDGFGNSVALSGDGDTALIGAWHDEDPNGYWAGSAYVFEQSGGQWKQATKITASNGDKADNLGAAVALSSDGRTALIGADSDEDPKGSAAGSAYVFKRTGGNWSRQAKLTAEDGDKKDVLGRSAALSSDGTTALVTAPSRNEEENGSAYVFEQSGGKWTQAAKFTEKNFHGATALSSDGSVALVGVAGSDDESASPGAAYIFSRSGGKWRQTSKLASGDSGDIFGGSAALSADGSVALIGAYYDEDPNGPAAGSAYRFEQSGSGWKRTDKLAAEDGDKLDYFGYSVAFGNEGSIALVGAPKDEDPNGRFAGSAYVFE